jgi:DNA polymerase-4
MQRVILHVDLDAFFCSVEELERPDLVGKPFVVGGRSETRGVVSSASYAARNYGIHSAMPTAQALRRCPGLVVLQGNYQVYKRISNQVMTILRASAPLVEQISIDEAFLDVSDDPLTGEQVAARLQLEIKTQFKLPTSWGVAGNKLVAKIATEIGKPNGLIVVPPGTEAEFLAPLPVRFLWGVGPKTQHLLQERGIQTIGDLVHATPTQLKSDFGDRGLDLAIKAKGIDERPVHEEEGIKSISNERTFSNDVVELMTLRPILYALSEKVGGRLRSKGLAGSTVRLKLRWSDFTTITRQTKLPEATFQDDEIFDHAYRLLKENWEKNRAVRLLGVGVSSLVPASRQLDLFNPGKEQDIRLLEALDTLRAKYGSQVVVRAVHLADPDNQDPIEGFSRAQD